MECTIFADEDSQPNQGMRGLVLLAINAVFVEGVLRQLFLEEISQFLGEGHFTGFKILHLRLNYWV